jgi:hypothetical protein
MNSRAAPQKHPNAAERGLEKTFDKLSMRCYRPPISGPSQVNI